MAVIPFDALFFGTASNNGRMLGEMDAKNAAVLTINEIAHILTGRSEIKGKKKKSPGLSSILSRLSIGKKTKK